jgi:subtilisin family serine protease
MPELGDIAGLRELWSRTRGDPRITVAILDGPVDIDRACFRGAQLRRYESYWENRANIDPSDLDIFLDIENGSGSDKEKAEKLRAEIADPQVIGRLILAFHATHIASIIFGQPESPVEGLAYECTGINIPISYNHDGVIDSVNLTRAVETALDVGANVIHVSACRPSARSAGARRAMFS